MTIRSMKWTRYLGFLGWWWWCWKGCINDKRISDHIGGYFTCDRWCFEVLSPIFQGLNSIIAPAELFQHSLTSTPCSSHLTNFISLRMDFISKLLPEVLEEALQSLRHTSECLLTKTWHNSAQKKPNKRNCLAFCQPEFNWATPNTHSYVLYILVWIDVILMEQFCT